MRAALDHPVGVEVGSGDQPALGPWPRAGAGERRALIEVTDRRPGARGTGQGPGCGSGRRHPATGRHARPAAGSPGTAPPAPATADDRPCAGSIATPWPRTGGPVRRACQRQPGELLMGVQDAREQAGDGHRAIPMWKVWTLPGEHDVHRQEVQVEPLPGRPRPGCRRRSHARAPGRRAGARSGTRRRPATPRPARRRWPRRWRRGRRPRRSRPPRAPRHRPARWRRSRPRRLRSRDPLGHRAAIRVYRCTGDARRAAAQQSDVGGRTSGSASSTRNNRPSRSSCPRPPGAAPRLRPDGERETS